MFFFKVCLEIHLSGMLNVLICLLHNVHWTLPRITVPFLKKIGVIFNWPWQLCWRGICSNQLEKIQEVEKTMENSGGLAPKSRSDWYRRPRLATWLVPFVLNSSRCAKVVEWVYTTPGVCGGWRQFWEVAWFKGKLFGHPKNKPVQSKI